LKHLYFFGKKRVTEKKRALLFFGTLKIKELESQDSSSSSSSSRSSNSSTLFFPPIFFQQHR
jgi:hypothetical protein